MKARFAVAVAASLSLMACTPEPFPDEVAGHQSAAARQSVGTILTNDTSSPADWQIFREGTLDGSQNVRKVSLGPNAHLLVRFENSMVAAGETLRIHADVSSPAGRQLQFFLQRHCNSDNGEDFERLVIDPSTSPYAVDVTHLFAAAYECVRMTVLATDKLPVDFEISNVKLTRVAAK